MGSDNPLSNGNSAFQKEASWASARVCSGEAAVETTAAAFMEARSSSASDSSVLNLTTAGSGRDCKCSTAFARTGRSSSSPSAVRGLRSWRAPWPPTSTEPRYTLCTPTATARERTHCCSRPPSPPPLGRHEASRALTSSSMSSGRVHVTDVTERSGGSRPRRSCPSRSWACSERAASSSWKSGNALSLSHLVITSTGGRGWPVER
mmetsp:Transcript_19081/g.59946  ORF Transcript_19081/g.59946 Transcript_19081/m.59946 type:complete len:206 (-) Transcript_19081:61-678(-)